MLVQEPIIDAELAIKKQLADRFQMDKYLYLIDKVKDSSFDITEDAEGFQKKYNGFWNLRRNKTWRDEYYKYFQRIRQRDSENLPSFKEILENVSRINKELNDHSKMQSQNWIEVSFSSKMLATLNPDMPVWDSRVINTLGIRKLWESNKSIDYAANLYEAICRCYQKYLKSDEGQKCLEVFDSYMLMPEYKKISDVKKLDYLLWGM